jgi:hypothetical protein
MDITNTIKINSVTFVSKSNTNKYGNASNNEKGIVWL